MEKSDVETMRGIVNDLLKDKNETFRQILTTTNTFVENSTIIKGKLEKVERAIDPRFFHKPWFWQLLAVFFLGWIAIANGACLKIPNLGVVIGICK
jgi:hypothetical protein